MAKVVEIGTGQPKPAKNPAAVALGRLGGLKGGVARAAKLSPQRKKEIAQYAAKHKWAKARGIELENPADRVVDSSGEAKLA